MSLYHQTSIYIFCFSLFSLQFDVVYIDRLWMCGRCLMHLLVQRIGSLSFVVSLKKKLIYLFNLPLYKITLIKKCMYAIYLFIILVHGPTCLYYDFQPVAPY
ncbi:hypothetical protein BC941DRAFT_19423 [Chlamydoabsidia padenii]|nr:hypothetical protein BC941DRAFT_19423 [Chlamydoabsidia padenii]